MYLKSRVAYFFIKTIITDRTISDITDYTIYFIYLCGDIKFVVDMYYYIQW